MITDVDGVTVGHWTDHAARTGCTVVLLPDGTVASAEGRGGAPATRELELLAPSRMMRRVDAVLLTGGSAFGLAAADGVMRFCEERGRGFTTRAGPVPIVPTLALFDLMVGDGSVRPGPDQGYDACRQAAGGAVALGAVGAGVGATVGAWRGRDRARPGGLASATVRHRDLVVSALLAVNAFGDIDGDGTGVDRALVQPEPVTAFGDPQAGAPANTTIGLIATNARLDKADCFLVAQGGHDGLARCIVPVDTRADGDVLVAAATGTVEAAVDVVRLLAVGAVERAVRSVG